MFWNSKSDAKPKCSLKMIQWALCTSGATSEKGGTLLENSIGSDSVCTARTYCQMGAVMNVRVNDFGIKKNRPDGDLQQKGRPYLD